MFGTLQDRLIKELAQAGIGDIDTANRWLREVYLPATTGASPAAGGGAERLRGGTR